MPSYGFDGTLTEVAEAYKIARAAEGAYRHAVWSGGQVTPGSGRAVNVAAIDAHAAGIWINEAGASVALDANSTSNKRIDYIVANVDWSTNTTTITKVTGTAAATPVAPALIQTPGTQWQLPLARVTVKAGATTIATGDIETCRPVRRKVDVYRDAVAVSTTTGSASSWKGIGLVTVVDPGWPYRLGLGSTVRFNQTESSGHMRTRIADPDSNAVYAEAATENLTGGPSPAVVGGATSDVLSGTQRVQLQMFPSGFAGGEQIQVDSHPANHFTVTVLPA